MLPFRSNQRSLQGARVPRRVNERARSRGRVVGVTRRGESGNTVEDGHRRTGYFEALRIERNREERPASHVQDVSGGHVPCVCPTLQNDPPLACLDRNGADSSAFVVSSQAVNGEEGSLASRKDVRPAVGRISLCGVQRREGPGLASLVRDTEQARVSRGKTGCAARAPTGSPRNARRAERQGLPAGEGDLLQFPIGPETDPFAVRREKGIEGPLRARDRGRLETVERPDIQALPTLGPPADIDQTPAVRREREARRRQPQNQRFLRRKCQVQSHQLRYAGRPAPGPAKQKAGDRSHDERCRRQAPEKRPPARPPRCGRRRRLCAAPFRDVLPHARKIPSEVLRRGVTRPGLLGQAPFHDPA